MRKEKKKEKKTKKKRSYICITQMHISTGWGGGDHPVLISLLVPDTNALHPSVAKGQYQMLPSTKEGFPTGGKRRGVPNRWQEEPGWMLPGTKEGFPTGGKRSGVHPLVDLLFVRVSPSIFLSSIRLGLVSSP
jgi:hypothetical protein